MKKVTISLSLTYKNLDTLIDCLSVTKKIYPLSWSIEDEETLEKIRDAYFEIYGIERSKNGEEESWP